MSSEIETLERRGCTCRNWSAVEVAKSFNPEAMRNVTLIGNVSLGSMNGELMLDGISFPSQIENATIANCRIGSNCLIRNVDLIAGYNIVGDVVVAQCGSIIAEADATFGIGSMVAVVNEGGGREVPLSRNMTSNIAHMIAFDRTDKDFIGAVGRMAQAEAEAIRGKAYIGRNASVVRCRKMKNVRVGEAAVIDGAAELTNGVVMSAAKQPTYVGAGVVAHTFVMAEGVQVTDGAQLKHAYIGQCTQVGNGFTAENLMAFANCQFFCGEAVSVLAGPYTVTHHKTSLLIAGAYSFFNAGSATNASNHHYKLGPAHQAVYRRGVKTGSGSYVLEPALIGAYTMVVGHHKTHPDTTLFPFSYLVERDGESHLMIAQNMKTIGMYRDEEKWKQRDARRPEYRRDQITPDVFNPVTISMMMDGVNKISELSKNDADTILYEGVRIRKGLMTRAAKSYEQIIDAYTIQALLQSKRDGTLSQYSTFAADWVDCGGFVCTKMSLEEMKQQVVAGEIKTFDEWADRFCRIADDVCDDTQAWATAIAEQRFGVSADTDDERIAEIAQRMISVWTDMSKAMAADAAKEFSDRLAVSYGLDGDADSARQEYTAIKGTAADNAVIAKCQAFCESKMTMAKDFITKFALKNKLQ